MWLMLRSETTDAPGTAPETRVLDVTVCLCQTAEADFEIKN